MSTRLERHLRRLRRYQRFRLARESGEDLRSFFDNLIASERCPESSPAGESSHPAKSPASETGDGVPPACSHYISHCAYVSPCCKKIYTCRVCHDENESHEIDRHAVTEIVCLQCHTRQHCMENRAHSNCPVCLEDLHSSRADLFWLPCGHLIHGDCWSDLLIYKHYSCPVCCQSMLDMTARWKEMDEEIQNVEMPDEYKNVRVWILCRDCHKVSETAYHVVGLKCHHCGSYNTCRTADNDETTAGNHEMTTEEMSDAATTEEMSDETIREEMSDETTREEMSDETTREEMSDATGATNENTF